MSGSRIHFDKYPKTLYNEETMAEKKDLLVRVDGRDTKQCKWTYYRASGPGGQHRNKTESGVRVKHLASGATAQSSEHKSREQNKRAAWKRLFEDKTFRTWLRLESNRASGELARVEREVANAMRPANLKVERRIDEKWEEWTRDDEDWGEQSD
jgi:protein subunit release factor B